MGVAAIKRARAHPSGADSLASLFHNRWSVPVLAELHRGSGAKFVTLLRRLGVSRAALTRTLKVLDDRGWSMRNPGYGHPMRPEYILTSRGRALGPACVALMERLGGLDQALALNKWSLPSLYALGGEARRFNQIAATAAGATPRALARALKDLVCAELIARELLDEYPPRTIYRATSLGAALLPSLATLERALRR
jgi:DNA-binding HxlR family transcriptional regulator